MGAKDPIPGWRVAPPGNVDGVLLAVSGNFVLVPAPLAHATFTPNSGGKKFPGRRRENLNREAVRLSSFRTKAETVSVSNGAAAAVVETKSVKL
jgi:hypothetical protein